ncbi:hypothetical protein D3C80_558020 [compost metagenome]
MQAVGELFRFDHVIFGQRHVDCAHASILSWRVAGHQVVVNHARFFVHFAGLIQTRHRKHQIGILRIALQGANQLVIRRRIVALLAELIRFVDHIAVSHARKLCWRAARQQFWIRQETLRFAVQSGLIQHRHLIGIIARVPLHALTHIAAHHRHGGSEIAALRQHSRQFARISRAFRRTR